jgi:hypothetical protein
MVANGDAYPRPLTEREQRILRFLLSVDAPGVDALRQQASVATVVGRCPCGCATIYLSVDRSAAPQSSIRRSPAIDTQRPLTDDPEQVNDLILFLDDGWLERVEIVHYGETPPEEFPPPDVFLPPQGP